MLQGIRLWTQLNAYWLHYAVDIVALVVIFACALGGAKKGFVRCFFGFISTVAAIVLAFLLMKKMLDWTNGLFGLQAIMQRGCANAFSKIKGFDIDVSADGVSGAVSGKLPAFLADLIIDAIGNNNYPEGTTLAKVAGDTVGRLGATVLSWIFVFLLVKLLFVLLRSILSAIIEKLPIVGRVNVILGGVVGFCKGLFFVCAVVAILALIPSSGITAFFNECLLTKALYNHNPLHLVLGWFFH